MQEAALHRAVVHSARLLRALEGILWKTAGALWSSRHEPYELDELGVESLVDFSKLILDHLEVVAALADVVVLVQRVHDDQLRRCHVGKGATTLVLALAKIG